MPHKEYAVPDSQRRRPRYPIALELRGSLTRTVDRDTGRTVDLSGGGLRFQTERELPIGEKL